MTTSGAEVAVADFAKRLAAADNRPLPQLPPDVEGLFNKDLSGLPAAILAAHAQGDNQRASLIINALIGAKICNRACCMVGEG